MAETNPLDQALIDEGASPEVSALARSIYQQESGGGKNTKTSNAGAVGGMQVIPSTFDGLKDKGWDINNPVHNARAGIRYITEGLKAANGDPALAASYYYGGPGGMAKAAKGIAVSDPRNPKAPNTLEYAQQVVGRMPTDMPAPAVVAAVPSVGLDAGVPVDIPQQVFASGIDIPKEQAINYGPDPWEAFKKTLIHPAASPEVASDMQENFAPKDWNYFQKLFIKPTLSKADFTGIGKWGKHKNV